MTPAFRLTDSENAHQNYKLTSQGKRWSASMVTAVNDHSDIGYDDRDHEEEHELGHDDEHDEHMLLGGEEATGLRTVSEFNQSAASPAANITTNA